jgi:ribosomal protein S18 acetylase RimI-like enzyme
LANIILEISLNYTISKIIEFKIRNYKRSDLADVAKCYAEGFLEGNNSPALEKAAKDYIPIIINLSDFILVAELDNHVRGYICGQYRKNKSFLKKFPLIFFAGIKLSLKYTFRRYNLTQNEKYAIKDLIKRATNLDKLPKVDYDLEVFNLSSQKSYRKGIGRALMNAFLEKAKAEDCNKIMVKTESIVNYTFYEKYGFQLSAEIDMSNEDQKNTGKLYIMHL